MNAGEPRFERAIAAIDAANGADPHVITIDGRSGPKELLHSELVTQWVHRLRPDPGEELLLAARGHHLRRWTSPRSGYPQGRAGYLRWRRDLHRRHAQELGEILASAGYPTETTDRVGAIVAKRGLGSDPEVQCFEDALCLVFLQTQLDEVALRMDDEKMVSVLAKTAAKMSDDALAHAAELPLEGRARDLLRRALGMDGDE